jgi:hypothetical protein
LIKVNASLTAQKPAIPMTCLAISRDAIDVVGRIAADDDWQTKE